MRQLALSVLAGTTLSFAAVADELAPLQAGTFVLGGQVASVYYTVQDGDYEVVTTLAPDLESSGVPVRFTARLAPGQKQTVSTGAFDTSAPPVVLEMLRDGNRLVAQIVTHRELAQH